MANSVLVFSIALNGYQWMYSKQLASQLRYAKKFGYHYQAVTQPFFSSLGVECCWLKLTLMHRALQAGYNDVMFLDADTMVQDNCPAINRVFEKDKYLYMAKGYSNRFNSGVMIARNNALLLSWLFEVIKSRLTDVEEKHDVGWGENGHIIQYSKNCAFIGEMEQRWNNTQSPNMDDFIRHQNYGPLRTGLLRNGLHRAISRSAHKIVKVRHALRQLFNSLPNVDELQSETLRVLSHYPDFVIANPE